MEVEPSPPTEVDKENLRTWLLQTTVKDAENREIKLINLFEMLRQHRAELIKDFLRLDKPTMAQEVAQMAQEQDDLIWMTNKLTKDDRFNSNSEIKNLKTLFSKITKLDDETLNALRYKYIRFDPKMFIPNYANYVGGRKLTRHRKSNAKSKSKRKHKRRSFKQGSHRRQRH